MFHTPVNPYVFNVRSSYQAEAERAVTAALEAGGEKVISLGRMITRGEEAPGVVYKGTLDL